MLNHLLCGSSAADGEPADEEAATAASDEQDTMPAFDAELLQVRPLPHQAGEE